MNRYMLAGLMLLGLAVGCKKAEEQAMPPAADQMAAPVAPAADQAAPAAEQAPVPAADRK